MERGYGCQDMVGRLRRVIVRPPDSSFAEADPGVWHYAGRTRPAVARREHARFVEILRRSGAEILEHDSPQPGRADALFVHDPAIVTDQGAILLRMGKELRRGEEDSLGAALKGFGVPILGRLRGKATAEGGDLLWLDHDTLAVGQGFRTNAEGLAQLETMLRPLRVQVVPVPLPCFQGPDACLHLMSLISLLDRDLAVVYLRYLPVPFARELRDRGIEWVEVPDAEFATMGPNVLALAPRDLVALQGSPVTRRRMAAAGCRVESYRGDEISLKAEGGPTCLTRPVLRG
jgi:dimethylargininase